MDPGREARELARHPGWNYRNADGLELLAA